MLKFHIRWIVSHLVGAWWRSLLSISQLIVFVLESLVLYENYVYESWLLFFLVVWQNANCMFDQNSVQRYWMQCTRIAPPLNPMAKIIVGHLSDFQKYKVIGVIESKFQISNDCICMLKISSRYVAPTFPWFWSRYVRCFSTDIMCNWRSLFCRFIKIHNRPLSKLHCNTTEYEIQKCLCKGFVIRKTVVLALHASKLLTESIIGHSHEYASQNSSKQLRSSMVVIMIEVVDKFDVSVFQNDIGSFWDPIVSSLVFLYLFCNIKNTWRLSILSSGGAYSSGALSALSLSMHRVYQEREWICFPY